VTNVPTKRINVLVAPGEETSGFYPHDVSVLCASCTHLDENLTCKAFPDGIPVTIVDGNADHREPYVGDRGVRFEQHPRVTSPELEDFLAQ
jgi:hypothetical protein